MRSAATIAPSESIARGLEVEGLRPDAAQLLRDHRGGQIRNRQRVNRGVLQTERDRQKTDDNELVGIRADPEGERGDRCSGNDDDLDDEHPSHHEDRLG
jgi:hypothetical protein